MRKMLGAVAAAALTLTAGVALGGRGGRHQSPNIDATTKMLTVGDKIFQWSENSTGVKLEELKEGDAGQDHVRGQSGRPQRRDDDREGVVAPSATVLRRQAGPVA